MEKRMSSSRPGGYSSGSRSYGGRSSGGRKGASGGRGATGARGSGGRSRDGYDQGEGRSGSRFIRKKVCRLCAERVAFLDYKEVDRIVKFLTEKGKIFPQRISGNCAAHQRMLAKAVKRARHASLIPFQLS